MWRKRRTYPVLVFFFWRGEVNPSQACNREGVPPVMSRGSAPVLSQGVAPRLHASLGYSPPPPSYRTDSGTLLLATGLTAVHPLPRKGPGARGYPTERVREQWTRDHGVPLPLWTVICENITSCRTSYAGCNYTSALYDGLIVE